MKDNFEDFEIWNAKNRAHAQRTLFECDRMLTIQDVTSYLSEQFGSAIQHDHESLKAAVANLQSQDKILSIEYRGHHYFPLRQFESGRVRPEIIDLVSSVAKIGLDGWYVLSFLYLELPLVDNDNIVNDSAIEDINSFEELFADDGHRHRILAPIDLIELGEIERFEYLKKQWLETGTVYEC